MRPTKISFLLCIMIFGLIVSCSDGDKNEDCISRQNEFVTSVNAPENGTVNKPLTIEVNFAVYNGCGGFGRFIEQINGNTRIIEVEAKYVGCICTTDVPIRTVTYEFNTDTGGNYELKFKSSPTEFITVNLTIN